MVLSSMIIFKMSPPRNDPSATFRSRRTLGACLLLHCWVTSCAASFCHNAVSDEYQLFVQLLGHTGKPPPSSKRQLEDSSTLFTCDAFSFEPCCGPKNTCGFGATFCECETCVDYRVEPPPRLLFGKATSGMGASAGSPSARSLSAAAAKTP
ncbi:unnamed protein product, partial [Amoebophrya sp. A25]|eukprot:GSA25T00003633001.1